ncbi:3-oxoacid CoA-transferase subunit B [Piscinibacter gummiphilus]|uniref:3-oxoacid CoA-transferase subunit B n=1 Tax=Piscinibacter gummiphilus TaxID=946333 RepID=A0ABZ0CUK8_9BURK|nr:3-oxoacid CoA-transferase subunit B [Piscinibacter gummiphilus]WOB08656.1 3-oxoacid CoA-transferase subunit B [Piscinibacter gummiphilus]
MTHTPLTRLQMAQRVAQDIPDGAYVNLGIGIPTLIAKCLPQDREVILHSENGILGMGPGPATITDVSLINASKEQVTLLPGAALFDHVLSFAMMRGGHLDLTVLGGFQVSQHGDLANWDTGAPGAIPAVGGAMDLAVGARRMFVVMEHVDKQGRPKLVRECSYPLTGRAVVDRVYTDLAVIDIEDGQLLVREIVPGLGFDGLQALTDARLTLALHPHRTT